MTLVVNPSNEDRIRAFSYAIGVWRNRPDTEVRLRMLQRLAQALSRVVDRELMRSKEQRAHHREWLNETLPKIDMEAFDRHANLESTDADKLHLDSVGLINIDRSAMCAHICYSNYLCRWALLEEHRAEVEDDSVLETAMRLLEDAEEDVKA